MQTFPIKDVISNSGKSTILARKVVRRPKIRKINRSCGHALRPNMIISNLLDKSLLSWQSQEMADLSIRCQRSIVPLASG